MERKTTGERRNDRGGRDVTAEGENGEVVVVGGLKVAVPVFEARLIKTPVQYLWWGGKAKRRRRREKWARAHL